MIYPHDFKRSHKDYILWITKVSELEAPLPWNFNNLNHLHDFN